MLKGRDIPVHSDNRAVQELLKLYLFFFFFVIEQESNTFLFLVKILSREMRRLDFTLMS